MFTLFNLFNSIVFMKNKQTENETLTSKENEMIPKSKAYKIVNADHIIIFEGSKKEAVKYRKQNSGTLWYSISKTVGDKIKP